jgi:hypothetical protein
MHMPEENTEYSDEMQITGQQVRYGDNAELWRGGNSPSFR